MPYEQISTLETFFQLIPEHTKKAFEARSKGFS